MKLEIKHIASYLPYGLETNKGKVYGFTTGQNDIPFVECDYSELYPLEEIKPLLKPLSEFDDGEDNTPEEIQKCCWVYTQKLISEHYDVFGLIDNGLAEAKG